MDESRILQALSRVDDLGDPDPAFLDRLFEAALREIGDVPGQAATGAAARARRAVLPWWRSSFGRLAVAAVAAVLVVVGTLAIDRIRQVTEPGASETPEPSATAAPRDYSSLGGRVLVEHLGHAIDGSEDSPVGNPERRRLYFMDPASMTGESAVEFLPGEPAEGKMNADVSADGSRIVFMDTAEPARIWIANIDGSGLRLLSGECGCSELDPAFDPTGTRIAYVRLDGGFRRSRDGADGRIDWGDARPVSSWIEIRDIETGATQVLENTVSNELDGIPEQPSWSPDGTRIVFNRTTWGVATLAESGVLQVTEIATAATAPAVTIVEDLLPGDADWSPDGSRIVFTDRPLSTMGSVSAGLLPKIYRVDPDGSNLQEIMSGGGASFMPDGRILFQSNTLWVMAADGTDARPINVNGDDLTETQVGYVYIAHWVGNP